MRIVGSVCATAVASTLVLSGPLRAEDQVVRPFPDRAVAWQEHDDVNLLGTPETNHLQSLAVALALRDGLSGEIDRIMSLDSRSSAMDINAADEVPCSTWYCARNHLHPMTPGEIVASTAAAPPRLPLTITSGKSRGDALGFEVVDTTGHKFLIKLDITGHIGMTTSAEYIGNAVFHAAGYNVPGAYLIDLDPSALSIDPRATYLVYDVQHRKFTPAFLANRIALSERQPNGRVRAVAIPWLDGQPLGGFDMKGTRPGDPNDRIPHQMRRSLRSARILCAWLAVLDPGPANTLDVLIVDDKGSRRFVRHNLIDFGSAFGSATDHEKGLHQEGEYSLEIGRTLASLFSFGIYQRPFQRHRADFDVLAGNYTAVGYFPAESFNPDGYRNERKNPAFMRMTDRDAYWGAKVVTSFTDAQIDALVAAAELPDPDAAYLAHALKVRRDILGRRYLRPMAAVETPQLSDDGTRLCFDDIAVARGYVSPLEARYEIGVRDFGAAKNAPRATTAWTEQAATGARSCVPYGAADPGTGYRIVEIRTLLAGAQGTPVGQVTKATRVHLRWRADENRFAVVGLERDE